MPCTLKPWYKTTHGSEQSGLHVEVVLKSRFILHVKQLGLEKSGFYVSSTVNWKWTKTDQSIG